MKAALALIGVLGCSPLARDPAKLQAGVAAVCELTTDLAARQESARAPIAHEARGINQRLGSRDSINAFRWIAAVDKLNGQMRMVGEMRRTAASAIDILSRDDARLKKLSELARAQLHDHVPSSVPRTREGLFDLRDLENEYARLRASEREMDGECKRVLATVLPG